MHKEKKACRHTQKIEIKSFSGKVDKTEGNIKWNKSECLLSFVSTRFNADMNIHTWMYMYVHMTWGGKGGEPVRRNSRVRKGSTIVHSRKMSLWNPSLWIMNTYQRKPKNTSLLHIYLKYLKIIISYSFSV